MLFKKIPALLAASLLLSGCDAELAVEPYLQNPGAHKMSVMFETGDIDAKVHYRKLGEEVYQTVTAELVIGSVNVRRAKIKELEQQTVYEYAVETDDGLSELRQFKTWPEKGETVDSFKLVAFSDVQGDWPERFKDVVENGIIKNECRDGLAVNCTDDIAALLIPGDLVTSGGNLTEWRNEFFAMGEALYPYVPFLAAIGNHDVPVLNYTNYIEAPSNGKDIYRDHWYSITYANVHLITLNTNIGINSLENKAQREWFDAELAAIADNDSIDFVITQFHHPCKSVFWVPGESAVSCDYQQRLENFTAASGKPSTHLFGHTHAYSRGQSRDQQHLWVNVAPTAGDIDYWGEYEQRNYDEFQKNYDEYGFNTITVTKSADKATLRLVRRSGGDGFDYLGYGEDAIRDDITLDTSNSMPIQPNALGPLGRVGAVSSIVLEGSAFTDVDSDAHLESHWQVTTEAGNYSQPLVDAWGNETRAENIWFEEDTQEGVDISRLEVGNLTANTSYYWRVRYRDEHLGWSEWSDEVSFRTE